MEAAAEEGGGMEKAERERGWKETGLALAGMPSCSSAPTSPSPSVEAGDSSPMSDYYDFACATEEEADGGGRRGRLGLGGMGALSFRTCSSAPSSPRSVRSLSLDPADFPPMSEYEEIPSQRWLTALESVDAGDSHSHGHPPAATVAFPQNEERRPSRRWRLPPFLLPRFTLVGGSDGGGGAWRKDKDRLLCYIDGGRHAFGDFSVAVVQANKVLEDQCQIESGPFGAFVGIYDGHGGPEAARYVCDHLYRNIREQSSGPLGVTAEAIETAFLQTDDGFIAKVAEMWDSHPVMAALGSCCLVGVICHQTVHVANLGDSRVVLGTKSGETGEITAIQMSTEHNVNLEAVRRELKERHPTDPNIVTLRHGVWRIKGIIQISRSIGDAYMKHAEYNREPLPPKFRIHEAMNMPILSAKPTIFSHRLDENDSFLIFASDGLWENLSNQEAVNIVHNNSRVGAAKRLVKATLEAGARKREMRYRHVQRIEKGVRRHFHDDITVVVLFIDHDRVARDLAQAPPLSVRSPLEI